MWVDARIQADVTTCTRSNSSSGTGAGAGAGAGAGTDATATAANATATATAAASATTEVVRALSNSCVVSSCEMAQRSVAQLLNLRKESCAKMSYVLVVRLRHSADAFALDMSQCSGSKCYELQQAVTSLSKLNIEATHERNKTKLVAVCVLLFALQCAIYCVSVCFAIVSCYSVVRVFCTSLTIPDSFSNGTHFTLSHTT